MKTAIINACLTERGGDDTPKTILMNGDGRIDMLRDFQASDMAINGAFDARGQFLLPGFIDTQVNGGGGVLFNDDPTVEGIRAIGAAHRRFGTTGFLPTLISDDPAVMRRAITAVDAAIERGVPGVLGIHLEGPYLNTVKRGVHDSGKFSRIGADEFDLLCSMKRGKTVVTLAPELTTPNVIKALTDRGIIVSAGHTLANYADGITAIDAGLTGLTHLFNAMTPLSSRNPGIIAAALEDPRVFCGIIADGYHVHPAMLRMAYRAKIRQNLFLVTDAMPSVGAVDKSFSLGGKAIHVENGKCETADGTLAGSDLDMWQAVRNARDYLNIPLTDAAELASRIPAVFLGLQADYGKITAGQYASFNLIGADNTVVQSWIKGQSAH